MTHTQGGTRLYNDREHNEGKNKGKNNGTVVTQPLDEKRNDEMNGHDGPSSRMHVRRLTMEPAA